MAASNLDVVALARGVETAAQAHGWELNFLNPIRDCPRPWLHRPGQHADSPKLYLSAGVHGDEPAPPLALLELARQPEAFQGLEVYAFPLLNPEGLAVGARENRHGVDCNRDYQGPKSDEVQGHIDALRMLPRVDTAICMHEDWESAGAYLYELHPGPGPVLSRNLLAAMAQQVPIEEASEIDEFPADHGVISRESLDLDELFQRPDWPEAFYLTRHHTGACYTLETPSSLPLEQRVAAQVAAVKAAASLLAGLPTRAA
ncbi:MAG: M14 family metallocarboxypeptidase [Verrucomicrobiota bacterium]